MQGLSQHIQNGKLHLHLREFLELMLKNSPDVQLARLDVYTAATQITAARAPFDPALGLGFTAERSISPAVVQLRLFERRSQRDRRRKRSNMVVRLGGTGSAPGTQVSLPQTINSLSQNSSITYNQILPTGQTLGTSFYSYRSSGDSYSSPLTYGILNFSFTQSLLQNRTGLQYRGPITVAKTQLLITSEQSEATHCAGGGERRQFNTGRPFPRATTSASSS